MINIQHRIKSMKTNPSRRLASYLSAGVCVAGAEARADLKVTFYPNTVPHTAGGGLAVSGGFANANGGGGDITYFRFSNGTYFTNGLAANDKTQAWVNGQSYTYGMYKFNGALVYGATEGINNYAQISYDTEDGNYEAVGQFDFKSVGAGQLLAVAYNDDGTDLPISAGALAITAAAVPEPSAALLALLALGSTACARRRRHAVPR